MLTRTAVGYTVYKKSELRARTFSELVTLQNHSSPNESYVSTTKAYSPAMSESIHGLSHKP